MQTTTVTEAKTDYNEYKTYSAYPVYRFFKGLSFYTHGIVDNVLFIPWDYNNINDGASVEFDITFYNRKKFHFRMAVNNYYYQVNHRAYIQPGIVLNTIFQVMDNISDSYHEAYRDMYGVIVHGNKATFIPDENYTLHSIKKYQNDFYVLEDMMEEFKRTEYGRKSLEPIF